MVINTLLIVNQILWLLLTLFKIKYLSNFFGFRALNPISIPLLIGLPFQVFSVLISPSLLLDEGLFNLWLNIAIGYTNLALLIEVFLIVGTLTWCKAHDEFFNYIFDRFKIFTPQRKGILAASVIFYFSFLCSLILLSSDFGLFNWILDPRTGYQYYRMGNGHWYGFAILFLSISFVLCTINQKSKKILFILFIFYLTNAHLLGAKTFLVSFSVYFFILLWLRKIKISKSLLFLTALIIAGFILVNFNPSQFYDFVLYFDQYVNSAMYFEEYYRGNISLFYGEIWLSDFYQIVPRSIFTDKPYVYGITLVNELFWPGMAEASHTPAFGGPISAFADFGVAGIIIMSLMDFKIIINMILLYILFNSLDFDKIMKSGVKLFIFIYCFSPSLLVYFTSFLTLPVLLMLAVIVLFSCGVFKRSSLSKFHINAMKAYG
jgi:hypothetical protein